MDNYMEQMLLCLIIASSVLAVNSVFKIIQNLRKIKQNQKTLACLENATEENTCSEPHAWDKISLAMKELSFGDYSVCKKCGFVGGTGWKLNGPALEIYAARLVQRARLEQLMLDLINEKKQRLQSIRDALIQKYNSPDVDKIVLDAINLNNRMEMELREKYKELNG